MKCGTTSYACSEGHLSKKQRSISIWRVMALLMCDKRNVVRLEGGLAEEPGKLRLLKELGAGEEEPGELGTGVEERAVAHT